MSEPSLGIHLMAKPAGPVCNLNCSYCFYLEKEQQFPPRQRFRMDDDTLQSYVQQYIAAQVTPEVEFTWQGGEPTLLGLEFFEQAVRYQRQFAAGKTIRNTLQTNGTLLDEAWVDFLAREGFLVGLSLDGPREVHELYRPDKRGRSSFDDVLRGLKLMQARGVAVNVLATVARDIAKYPLEIYRFLKAEGVRFIQFNPVVERMPRPREIRLGQTFAAPLAFSEACPTETGDGIAVTEQSVAPAAYGEFLAAVFDEWVRQDVGQTHVMNFEWALAAWCQLPATICLFAPSCGKAAIVEHDGSIYSCDHFMYPEYRLGNLRDQDPAALLASPFQIAFGAAKETTLPRYCRQCDFLFACRGECPKNRFVQTPDGEPGLNYLCPGYKIYFGHISQYMNAMAKLVAHGEPASLVMQAIKRPLAIVLGRKDRSDTPR